MKSHSTIAASVLICLLAAGCNEVAPPGFHVGQEVILSGGLKATVIEVQSFLHCASRCTPDYKVMFKNGATAITDEEDLNSRGL